MTTLTFWWLWSSDPSPTFSTLQSSEFLTTLELQTTFTRFNNFGYSSSVLFIINPFDKVHYVCASFVNSKIEVNKVLTSTSSLWTIWIPNFWAISQPYTYNFSNNIPVSNNHTGSLSCLRPLGHAFFGQGDLGTKLERLVVAFEGSP